MAGYPPPWGFIPDGVSYLPKYKRQEKKLHPDLQGKLEEAINDLLQAEIPTKWRPRPYVNKRTQNEEQVYLADLHGTKYRITFYIEQTKDDGHILVLRRVGPHEKIDKDP